jgi:uncharacterized protein YkwD
MLLQLEKTEEWSMRKWMMLLAVVLGCAWLGGCFGDDTMEDPDPGGDATAQKQAMLDRHNDTRTSLGLAEYAFDSRLNTIAQQHADWMLSTGNLSHTDGSGGSVGDRATAAGYGWVTVGENIARASSGSNAYEMWLGSSGHYANITNADFADIGIGLAAAGGVQYWCVVFGLE